VDLEFQSEQELSSYSIDKSTLPELFTGRFRVVAVSLAACSVAQCLHERLQALAMWMIDAASCIDVTDSNWQLLVLLAEVDVPALSVQYFLPIGYVTLYKFHTPTRKERPMSIRLAQMLVFPAMQRYGHGTHLLRCAHRFAEGWGAYQLTVEDPAEGFRRLRDTHDFALFVQRDKSTFRTGIQAEQALQILSGIGTTWASTAVSQLHITEQQCLRAAEAMALHIIATAAAHGVQFTDAANEIDAASLWKAWRLQVKRRIYASDADVRAAPAELRKRHLHESFEWDLASYTAAVHRIFGVAAVAHILSLKKDMSQ
jgi:GNAT superfamily N-acetyltransferase